MSWGYVPKKLKRQRRERLLRKKYKNFSCLTCAYGLGRCPKNGAYYRARPIGGRPIAQNCDCWKISTEAKFGKRDINTPNETDPKKSRKGFFKKIFK